MGVYVKGMEMPTNCSECAFCGYYGNGEHMCDIIEKAVEYDSGKTSRRDDCPLIPVPQHGDLIDRNKLYEKAADAIEELSHENQSLAKRVNEAAELLHKRGKPPKWIPVTERLPERGQDVLVMVHWRDYPEDMMCYGRKYKTRWYLWNGELGEIYKGFDITHWMPLPQPPEEET